MASNLYPLFGNQRPRMAPTTKTKIEHARKGWRQGRGEGRGRHLLPPNLGHSSIYHASFPETARRLFLRCGFQRHH